MYVWNLLVVTAVISGCKGQDFTSWCPDMASDLTKCTNDFLSSLSNISSLFDDAAAALNIQSLMSSAISPVCLPSTKVIMNQFYDCIFGKMFACIPPDWRKAFPDVGKVKGSLTIMCDNINNMDITCLADTTKANAMVNCVMAGTLAAGLPILTTPDGYLAYVCSQYPLYTTCIQSAYGNCPLQTAPVMIEVYNNQKPVGCDACTACDACVFRPSLLLYTTLLGILWI